jgi:predicted TIM-barrel fold metal-dependent hydrolase
MSVSLDAPNPHFAVRPEWLARHDEPVIEPDLPIVDAHHHLWDRSESRYFFFDFLNDVRSGHNVQASVFMECGAMYRRDGPPEFRSVGEIEFANGAAAISASGVYGECRVCAGIIGHGDLLLGDKVTAVLERQAAAGGGRFRGVRQISAWHPDPAARGSLANPPPNLLTEASFREGLAAVKRLGLSFDAYMYHTQLLELVDLASSFLDTPIILNHTGGAIGIGPYAGKRDDVFKDWRSGIVALARCPNVHMKLGGLGMRVFGFDFGARALPPSSEELAKAWAPYIETCIEAFGAERCMFESNFPVDKGTCSYLVLWNAFKRIVLNASEQEKRALLSETAARVYRLTN